MNHLLTEFSFRYLPEAMMKEITWDDQWVGYDDADTIKEKKAWADNQCFGGTMAWSVDFDSGIGRLELLRLNYTRFLFTDFDLVEWNQKILQTEVVVKLMVIRSVEIGLRVVAVLGNITSC